MLSRLNSKFVLKLLKQQCSSSSCTKSLTQSALTTETADAGTQEEAPCLIVENDADITLIGINRERSRNSIDKGTAVKLCEAIQQFEEDKSSPVAVLYGIGGTFCAGLDVLALEQQLENDDLNLLFQRIGSVGPTRRSSCFRKPIVCGINGYCVAGGLELALMCDLRVMEDTALLGFFNRRLGVPLSDGGTIRLAAAVGYSRALDLIVTGRRVTGSEALEMGLINRLVATGASLGQAVNLAFSIAKFPMASLLHDRKSVLESRLYQRERTFRNCVQQEIMNISPEVLTEMKEGAQRFLNSKEKGARTNSWNIKERPLPDWEREEIAREVAYAKSKLKNKVS